MKQKGEITVYLSLCFTIILSLLFAVVESATDRAMRMRTENAMDMGMQSVFAEFSRQLLEKYDLYFIDSAYGADKGNEFYVGEQLKDYMSYNLNPYKKQLIINGKDLFGLKVNDVKINVFSLATDNNAKVYKRQAIQAVKDRFGASIIGDLDKNSKDYKASGIIGYDVDSKREENRNKMHSMVSKAKDEDGNRIHFDDPTKKIEQNRAGILSLIFSGEEISNENIDNSSLASNRSLAIGDGIVECSDNLDSITNNLLFTEYLGWKFGCYTDTKDNKGIKYELEYILKNKTSDIENLKSVVKDLLVLREAANVIYLFNDSAKREEARAVAIAISVLLLMPELEEVLTNVILFSWGFAESCVDIKTLLDGGKVPIMKNSGSWVLPLSQALVFKAHLKDGMAKSQGLDYKTYLKLFMVIENSDKKVWRSLDMIEKNIKASKGNSNFKIDNCIEYMDAEVAVSGRNGFDVCIRRNFGYMAMPRIQ